MVLIVLHKKYIGFANVRVATLPHDSGRDGELRVTREGFIQHRLYEPKTEWETSSHLSISCRLIDVEQSHVHGCQARIVDILDYEYWFRFPSDVEGSVFALHMFGHGQTGVSANDLSASSDDSQHDDQDRLSRARQLLYDHQDSGWIMPWTRNQVRPLRVHELSCRCHEIGTRHYIEDHLYRYENYEPIRPGDSSSRLPMHRWPNLVSTRNVWEEQSDQVDEDPNLMGSFYFD